MADGSPRVDLSSSPESPTSSRERFARTRVLLVGLGNIGSFLAPELARRGVGLLRLVDRDTVEPHNTVNQAFSSTDVGRAKVEVIADRLRDLPLRGHATVATTSVEPLHADIEDVPLGLFDVDLCLGALDSLRARQLLASERAWPLGVPVIDGGVGGTVGCVKLIVPGAACLECAWGPAHYRQLTREMPCDLLGTTQGAPTRVTAQVGQAVAQLMADEVERWLSYEQPVASRETSFELASGRRFESRLARAARCRFEHRPTVKTVALRTANGSPGTVGDLLHTAREALGSEGPAAPLWFTFRRGLLPVGLFAAKDPAEGETRFPAEAAGGAREIRSVELEKICGISLADLGLSEFDRIGVKNATSDVFISVQARQA